MPKLIDLTGVKFGRLTAIERSDNRVLPCGQQVTMWKCICDCGKEIITSAHNLRTGHTQSCGCYNIDKIIDRNTKHNHSSERLYKIWNRIIGCCYNKNRDSYQYYGGIGIQVCDEWKNDYMAFREWAYSNGYDENALFHECTIDRIDVNGNYCPENCRWVDFRTQSNNKSTTFYVEYKGQKKSIAEWSQIVGIDRKVLYSRIHYSNWPVERAMETPVKKKEKK